MRKGASQVSASTTTLVRDAGAVDPQAPAPTTLMAEFMGGIRAMLPWLAGITPFGLVIGVSAAQADFSTFAGWLTGPLIAGGSAQIATIELLEAGAAPPDLLQTANKKNLRNVIYTAAIAQH
jgi:predicted branched-subunit amino acid permease